MPKIQIADKPTLDLVKTDTTAILNKTNGNSTALTNIQNGINTANSGINTANSGINSVKSTLGTVNNNVTSIRLDNAAQFAKANQKNSNFAYSMNIGSGYSDIGSGSISPITICHYRKKTMYYPGELEDLVIKQSSNVENSNLWQANVSPPRSDDDFLYYADFNAGYINSEYKYTEDANATKTMTKNVFIHYFDGGKWSVAPVITDVFTQSATLGVVNVFPTNKNHNLFLYCRNGVDIPSTARYYYLTANNVDGYPTYYTAKSINIPAFTKNGIGACAFFPSPVSKNPGSGQFAWYAIGQTGEALSTYPQWTSDLMRNYKDIVTIVGAYTEGGDFTTKVYEAEWSVHSSSTGMHNSSEFMQAASCHLNSDPWFIFGGLDLSREKEIVHITSTPTNVSIWRKKRGDATAFFDPYDLFNSFGNQYSVSIMTSSGGSSSDSLYTSILSFQIPENYGKYKNIALTNRGTVCFDETGIYTLPGDYPAFSGGSNLFTKKHDNQNPFSSWSINSSPVLRNIGFLRNKLYLLPTATNGYRTMLVN